MQTLASSTQQRKVVRRPIHGVLLLDKPMGWSSNDILQKVKWLLRAEKAGHTGTLDPLASGVLPLCFGAATKFSQLQLDADKTYSATMCLGIKTSTGDAEGEVIAIRPVAVSVDDMAYVQTQFVGSISQVPPMYSALKKDGKALYEYARAGIEVDRVARQVKIHKLNMIPGVCRTLGIERENRPQRGQFAPDLPAHSSAMGQKTGGKWAAAVDSQLAPPTSDSLLAEVNQARPAIDLEVTCSKGTYIRTLAQDMGEALGCGAYLTALRRTGTGSFEVGQCVTLDALQEMTEEQRIACLLPVHSLLVEHTTVVLDADNALRFSSGLRRRGTWPDAAQVAVYAEPGNVLLGTASVSAGELIPRRLLSPIEIEQMKTAI